MICNSGIIHPLINVPRFGFASDMSVAKIIYHNISTEMELSCGCQLILDTRKKLGLTVVHIILHSIGGFGHPWMEWTHPWLGVIPVDGWKYHGSLPFIRGSFSPPMAPDIHG